MKISVITATFNSAATLADTLASVVAQTYPDVEHIIVDGASTDSTLTMSSITAVPTSAVARPSAWSLSATAESTTP